MIYIYHICFAKLKQIYLVSALYPVEANMMPLNMTADLATFSRLVA